MDRPELKEKITILIQEVKKKITTLQQESKPISPENSLGRISRMDAINNKSVIEASLRDAEQKLIKLQIALEKVDEPDFGICIRCKKEIPEGRLMLLPHAATCVNCA